MTVKNYEQKNTTTPAPLPYTLQRVSTERARVK